MSIDVEWWRSAYSAVNNASCVFPNVTIENIERFEGLCYGYSVPVWYDHSWYKSSSGQLYQTYADQPTFLCTPFVSFESSFACPTRLTRAVERSDGNLSDDSLYYLFPHQSLNAGLRSRCIVKNSGIANLKDGKQAWLEDLHAKHRYEMRKAMQLDCKIVSQPSNTLTPDLIRWLLASTHIRHHESGALHAMGLVLWCVARNCIWHIMYEGQEPTCAIAVLHEPVTGRCILMDSVRGIGASSQFTTQRLILNAIDEMGAFGCTRFDPTEHNYAFRDEGSIVTYKRKVCNDNTEKVCMSATNAPDADFQKPYYHNREQLWVLAEGAVDADS